MNTKAAVINFIPFSTVFVLLLLLTHNEVSAQMTVEYPKRFSFSGLVELSYLDYFYQFPRSRGQEEYHVSYFQQTYGLTVRGFIYHPRLAVFTAEGSFRDEVQLAHVGGGKTNSKLFRYGGTLTLLPYRPVSLDIFAFYDDLKIEPIGSFINEAWSGVQSVAYKNYGARLKINRHPLPFMSLEYNHEEEGLLGVGGRAGEIKSDQFTLDIRGSLHFWQTVYQALVQYEDFSSPDTRYKSKSIQLNTTSTITRGIQLQNAFNYSDIDYFKLLSFNSQLGIYTHARFTQYYSYLFYKSQYNFSGIKTQGIPGQTSRETINSATGSWTYRFVKGPTISLSLNYGLRKENSEKGHFYGIYFSASYARSFLGLNFAPSYRLIIKKDDIKGDFLEHDIEVNLVTRNLRFGTVYSDYSFTATKEQDKYTTSLDQTGFGATNLETDITKTNNVVQLLRTGVRGRLGKILSRAQWNVETQILYSTGTIDRTNPGIFFDELAPFLSSTLHSERKIRSYTIRGNISYPVGWATIFFNTDYSLGQSNGQSFSRFFYEERINYPVLRHLFVLARWKQIWDRIGGDPTQRTDEYDLSAEYRLGQSTIGLYGAVLRSKAGNDEIYLSRVFLKFRRRFF